MMLCSMSTTLIAIVFVPLASTFTVPSTFRVQKGFSSTSPTLNAKRRRNNNNVDNPNTNNSIDEDRTQKPGRKKKKNKYGNFSKADKMDIDPFEALIAESTSKIKSIKKEATDNNVNLKNLKLSDVADDDGDDYNDEDKSKAFPEEKREREKREFPDTKKIDPYDPTTYGYTELGAIMGPHGVHGLVKIAAVTGFAAERLCQPGIRHLKAVNRRSPREIRLEEGRHRIEDEYLVKFEGIDGRDDATKLRGSVLYARQEERPEDMEDDEYLITDLVGLDVMLVTGYGEDHADDGDDYEFSDDEDNDAMQKDIEHQKSLGGNFVGVVRGVVLAEEMCSIPGLGQDLLEIVLPRGNHGMPSWKDEMVLIPLVPSIVPTVDMERNTVYIDPPEGLLDLTYVHEENVRIKGFLPPASDPKNKR